MKVRAFSLIELLVVVAIIAILAAIALPTYQAYSIKSKIGNTLSIMSALFLQGEQYYARNGNFASAYGLGLGSAGIPWLVTSSITAGYSPYLNAIYVNIGYNSQQMEVGLVYNFTNFSGYNSGATTPPNVISGTGNFLFIDTFLNANKNGTFTSYCTYRTDFGMTAAIAAAYLPANCQTPQNNVPGSIAPN